jgi:hypothetical protein
MKFGDLLFFIESTINQKNVPGIVCLVWWNMAALDIKDYFYLRAYGKFRTQPPPDVWARIQGYIEAEDNFIKMTNIERLPTPEEQKRLKDASDELFRRDATLGSIIQSLNKVYVGAKTPQGEKVTVDGVRTFAVDQSGNLCINLGYANACTFEQLVGVLAHEAMHISLKHWNRLGGRSPFKLVNIATDAFINEDLVTRANFQVGLEGGVKAKDRKIQLRFMHIKEDVPDINLAQPKDYTIEADMRGKTWEQLFDILKESLETPSVWKKTHFELGDVVYDKFIGREGGYGVIEKVTTRGSTRDYVIRPITKQEAGQLSKQKYDKF